MKSILFLSLALFTTTVRATDANTDCDQACLVEGSFLGKEYSYTDYLCRSRCLTEKTIAQKTGVTSCDIWRVNPSTVSYYFGAIKAISEASRRWGQPEDVHACHDYIDGGAKAASAVGAAKTMYSVYENGLKAADLLSRSSLAGAAVSEGVKHFFHCACTGASYQDGLDGTGATSKTLHYVSMTNGRAWQLRHGKAANTKTHNKLAKENLGGPAKRRISGYFLDNVPTVTEAICNEESFTKTGMGEASLKDAYQTASGRFKGCLFRVTEARSIRNIDDYRFASLIKGKNWGISWQKNPDIRPVYKQAKQYTKMSENENPDREKLGVFSSSRITNTLAACDVGTQVSGDLQTSESVIYLKGGRGAQSLQAALDEAKQKGYKTCLFETRDVRFGAVPETAN